MDLCEIGKSNCFTWCLRIKEKSLKDKKKIISNDVKGEEDLSFISLLSKFLKLFIEYGSHIRGEGIKHHIKLKESMPIAQKL